MKTPKLTKNRKTPKPFESTADFKLRIRQIITGTKPYHAHPRQIDCMTDAEREVLQLKGML